MSWQKELINRYPHLFGNPTSGYPSVDDGWKLIVEKAIERIDAAVRRICRDSGAEIRIVQIKEKLGGLRIYLHHTALPSDIEETIRDAVDLAEARSDTTCEICGSVGRLYDRQGWYLTRCERHAQGEPVSSPNGDPHIHIQYALIDGKMQAVRCRRYDRELDAFVDAPLPPDSEWGDKK